VLPCTPKGEEALLPYFQDTLQHEKYGRHGKAGHDEFHKLLAEGKKGEAALLPYFQDTLQHEKYGRHGKEGHDRFIELVEQKTMSLARDTPYCLDTWQYEAYGIGGYASYKEATLKVREHASEILTVQWNGQSSVETRWTCMSSCCANKGRWCGRKDKFSMHQLNKHAGGNASFVETVNRAKNRSKVGFRSLCPSARVTPMTLSNLKSHLALAGIHV